MGGELCVSRAYAAIPIKSIIGPLLLLRSSSIHTFPEHGSFQNTRELNWGSDKKCLANVWPTLSEKTSELVLIFGHMVMLTCPLNSHPWGDYACIISI